jgi:hypothetical protein
MKAIVLALFGALTLGAVLLTYYDVGAGEARLKSGPSVRHGSLGHSRYHGK